MQPPSPAAPPGSQAGAGIEPPDGLGAQALRPVLVGVSALGGCQVLGCDGERVGVVTEVIADVAAAAGRIAYLLVAPDHAAPGQSELRALPWSAAVFDAARHCFTLRVTAQAVRNAPQTIRAGWPAIPDAPDEQWQADIHRYYHPGEPYPPSASQSPPQSQPQSQSQPQPQPQPQPDPVERDFLPELGLASPLRRRPGPDPK